MAWFLAMQQRVYSWMVAQCNANWTVGVLHCLHIAAGDAGDVLQLSLESVYSSFVVGMR